MSGRPCWPRNAGHPSSRSGRPRVPFLVTTRGAIVNVSSVHAVRASSGGSRPMRRARARSRRRDAGRERSSWDPVGRAGRRGPPRRHRYTDAAQLQRHQVRGPGRGDPGRARLEDDPVATHRRADPARPDRAPRRRSPERGRLPGQRRRDPRSSPARAGSWGTGASTARLASEMRSFYRRSPDRTPGGSGRRLSSAGRFWR